LLHKYWSGFAAKVAGLKILVNINYDYDQFFQAPVPFPKTPHNNRLTPQNLKKITEVVIKFQKIVNTLHVVF